MMANILFLFLLGIISGSFLGCLHYRFYHKVSLIGRSFCPHCLRKILYRDLIPLLSFATLKGKCRFCHSKIGNSYFFMELAVGLLFVLVYLNHQTVNLWLIRDLIFCLILFFIMIFDWSYYLILDKVIWPAIFAAILLNLSAGYPALDIILSMLIGAGFFLCQYLISKGKWIGFGDVKLGLLIGAMFDWQLTVMIIGLAYVLGGLVALIMLVFKKKSFGDILPLGSFVAGSGIIALLGGNIILRYFNQ